MGTSTINRGQKNKTPLVPSWLIEEDDDESINAAIDAVSLLNNGIQRYSKRYLCDKVLHCSESCFNTYLAMGLIPDGYKEIGFKELRWSIKDMDKALEYRRKH